MSDATLTLIVSVASTTIIAIGALFVAQKSFGDTRKLERERWRRELYATMMRTNEDLRDVAHDLAEPIEPDQVLFAQSRREAYQTLQEIRLVAPQMARQAELYHQATANLVGAMGHGQFLKWQDLDSAYLEAQKVFLAAAQSDLA